MNIISRPGAATHDTGRVGRELAQLLQGGDLDLPGLPDTAVRVLALTGSPVARGSALAEIAAGDERLQSRLVQVGRHAAALPDLHLDTPQEVIGWLGPAEASDIVYTAALHDALLGGREPQVLAQRLWQVATAAAIWSREAAALARRRSLLTYACGLLHEVGKPLVALACGDLAVQFGVELDEAALAGLVHEHHAAVAALVARRWPLPEAVRACMDGTWQGDAGDGAGPRERPCVYLGHHLAELVANQGPEFAREALAADPVLDLLNIGPDRFRGLVERAAWVTRQVEAY